MMKVISRVARFLWSFPQIQRLLKQIKQGSAPDTAAKLKNLQPTGRFVREDGTSVSVLAGYRDIVQPGWQNALLPTTHSIPTIRESEQKKGKVSRTTDDILRRLAALGLSLEGKDVLEFGCNDGSKLFSLSEKIGGSFSGMDLPRYYSLGAVQKSDTNFSSESEYLMTLREATSKAYTLKKESSYSSFNFYDDDICASSLASEKFDVIFSWNVLEHVADPGSAFSEIYRLLRPGGIAFNKYNPFFCQGGGHSLCTLDFPWGHVRLSHSEFNRYLAEIRPLEKDAAIDFYGKGLNRLSIANLREIARDIGFTEVLTLAYPTELNIDLLTLEVLAESRLQYPYLEYIDLVANGVYQVVQKPLEDQ